MTWRTPKIVLMTISFHLTRMQFSQECTTTRRRMISRSQEWIRRGRSCKLLLHQQKRSKKLISTSLRPRRVTLNHQWSTRPTFQSEIQAQQTTASAGPQESEPKPSKHTSRPCRERNIPLPPRYLVAGCLMTSRMNTTRRLHTTSCSSCQ